MQSFTVKVLASVRVMGELVCTLILTFDGLNCMNEEAIARIINTGDDCGSAEGTEQPTFIHGNFWYEQ